LAPTLKSALLNQTILECADWGQITVSYTVLPLRRSSTCGRGAARLGWLAAAKKRRQINSLACFSAGVGGRDEAIIAPTTRGLREAS
jgi:hypothetical protein